MSDNQAGTFEMAPEVAQEQQAADAERVRGPVTGAAFEEAPEEGAAKAPATPSFFELTREDVAKMIIGHVQLGTSKCMQAMKPYIVGRRADGTNVFNLRRTWAKLVLAARILAAIDNPKDVAVISSRPYAQRATMKMSHFLGYTAFAGRFHPGTFTNRVIPCYMEPRVIIVSDPRIDFQAVHESSFANIPVIAFCNSDSPLTHVDCAIPCNNRGRESIGLMYWMLTREVMRMQGKISRSDDWIMPDMFVHMEPADIEAQVAADAAAEAAKEPEDAKTGSTTWDSDATALPGAEWKQGPTEFPNADEEEW